MAKPHELTPRPSALSASLRDLGYSVETAVADIIDNSITAKASQVDIFCVETDGELALAILDNGTGMDKEKLLEAMRPGTNGPDAPREETDLGRYGLGLKTASFSQCRRLTVVSAQNGKRCGAEWDLDLVFAKDKWVVNVLNAREIAEVPYTKELGKQGTLVLWRKIDKFDADAVPEILARLTHHLELVFHRFLAGERGNRNIKKIVIKINNNKLEPFDPFLKEPKLRSQWKIQNEKFQIEGNVILINGYTLPLFSRLPAQLEKKYRERSDYHSNQGFYVYRNFRLMCWGDWFKIIPKQESSKYSRVQIDFPSTLDHLWKIDIKKSTAVPPQNLRKRLSDLIESITEPSTRIIKGRVPKISKDNKFPIWERTEYRSYVDYTIKKDHALVESIENLLDENGKKLFASLLDFIATALPLQRIYADGTEKQFEPNPVPDGQLLAKLEELYDLLATGGTPPDMQTFKMMTEAWPRLFHSAEGQKIVEQFIAEKWS